MPLLFANPEARFSRVKAHVNLVPSVYLPKRSVTNKALST